jgi:hypothetical protein
MKPVQLIAIATCVMALGVPGAHAGEPVRSAGKLAFADAGTLFVADWQGARIHALSVPQPTKAAGKPFNLKDVQGPIAKALQADRSSLRFEDMAVQPGAEIAYVSLSVQRGKSSATPALVSINADGRVKVINLKTAAATSASIADAPAPELKFWRDVPAQSLTVTGMIFHANKLYVAGLSNRTFASTLRIYDYPFAGRAKTSTVEMYHPVHNQIETRAPIRTMAIVDIAGLPTMIAAFTCTPLVAIPLSDLKDGAHVAAKTIAELGWGSEPIDLVTFNAGGTDFALLVNSSRAADLIPLNAIADGVAKPGLREPIKWPGEPLAGVKAIMAPLSAVTQLDNLNKDLLLALRRDDASGNMQLVTIPKGAYLRVSDFVNEYDFAGFQYQPGDGFREYHKLFHALEGYPELAN